MSTGWTARGSTPVGGREFPHLTRPVLGTGCFPGVKGDQAVTLTHHPLLVPWSRKSRGILLLHLWTVMPVQNLSACTVQLYLYSPSGPYNLYRASVPVQYSYTSTPPMDRTACTEHQCLYSRAIPLLPLWTVQPVQTLSACTEPQCLYSTAISLLPLLAVRPVQSLSACTRVHFTLHCNSVTT